MYNALFAQKRRTHPICIVAIIAVFGYASHVEKHPDYLVQIRLNALVVIILYNDRQDRLSKLECVLKSVSENLSLWMWVTRVFILHSGYAGRDAF